MCTMLDQCRRRWAGVVQMVYKCFVFAGMSVQNEKNMYVTLTDTSLLSHKVKVFNWTYVKI